MHTGILQMLKGFSGLGDRPSKQQRYPTTVIHGTECDIRSHKRAVLRIGLNATWYGGII